MFEKYEKNQKKTKEKGRERENFDSHTTSLLFNIYDDLC
jgi:hypothetical protein